MSYQFIKILNAAIIEKKNISRFWIQFVCTEYAEKENVKNYTPESQSLNDFLAKPKNVVWGG